MTISLCETHRCNGTIPTDASLCEPGIVASDPNLPLDQQNITASVVVCPRADCLMGNGCSPQVRHWNGAEAPLR